MYRALIILSIVGSAGAEEPAAWKTKVASHLDARMTTWLEWGSAQRRAGGGTTCISCHTVLPYALARPYLGNSSDPEKAMIKSIHKRVSQWESIRKYQGGAGKLKPFYTGETKTKESLGTEAILNAVILTHTDLQRGKKLSTMAQTALDHLWKAQQPNGAWHWLDFGLLPWEKDGEYFGAALAAMAVGRAEDQYPQQKAIKSNINRLQAYIKKGLQTQSLHNRTMALWAASSLAGTLTKKQQVAIIAELKKKQSKDGGWHLQNLGSLPNAESKWKAQGGHPAADIQSDGYATGLVVAALSQFEKGRSSPEMKRAIAWLKKYQQKGNWPAVYLNRNRDTGTHIGRFMRDASTAFAALGLSMSH